MCQMRGALCEVHGTKLEVRGTRHKIRDTWYVVRGTLVGSAGRAHAKMEIMYITWEPVGSEPPCHKGSWWGLHTPCTNFTQKKNELCFENTCMLQIAHKFDACALFGMPGMCTWYMVHGMRYEVRGMWYVVQGTEYVALGTRHEVQNTLYDYRTKRASPRNMSI
jgi:hypothetical protein